MAIYHFSAKIIARSAGRSAVAAAAYRAATRLYDERLGRHHDFSNKAGVVHGEVMLPEGAPERLGDREALWNEVEATEKRKDAQLAREVEFAIPREMAEAQGIALVRDFVATEFVARGMVADLNVHWDIGAEGQAKPHAHVMLALRAVDGEGFGAKVREWNATALLQHWRGAWESHVNERLAALGIDARIDHRSYATQGIELEPQHKIGAAAARREVKGEASERCDDHRRVARDNGALIVADPRVALDALTRTQATFTHRDLALFAHRHSADKAQYDVVLAAMRASDHLVRLGRDGRGDERFTTVSMLSAEQALVRHAAALTDSRHSVAAVNVRRAVSQAAAHGLALGDEQRRALDHVTRGEGLSLVLGVAGSGKSAMLGVARDAWEAAGYRVHGAALSGIAAENLEAGSGIASRTIASLEHGWARGYDRLERRDILVVDEAAMIGTRQLERVLGEARHGGAKVVLVGDIQQLQAIEAGAAFRLLAERHGAAEIAGVRRQEIDWMREATRALATSRSGEALGAYARAGTVEASDSRAAARTALVARWEAERRADPAASRIILTHLNKEVFMLNDTARATRRQAGELGPEIIAETERGPRAFAAADRILFLRNERELGVKNGSLGTVEAVAPGTLGVRLDNGHRIDVDLKSYAHVDHGYAATIHKAQGMTVDRTHLLATPGLDAHGAYVALSRHRLGTVLHYGRDDFDSEAALRRTLARERPKDMALDYGQDGDGGRSGGGKGRAAPGLSAGEQPGAAAADSERARSLRAMVAARVAEARPTAETVREGLAKAASAVLGRGRDHGAER